MWGALAEYRSVTSDINASILASRLRALFVFMTTPIVHSAADFAVAVDGRIAFAVPDLRRRRRHRRHKFEFRIFSKCAPHTRIASKCEGCCHSGEGSCEFADILRYGEESRGGAFCSTVKSHARTVRTQMEALCRWQEGYRSRHQKAVGGVPCGKASGEA